MLETAWTAETSIIAYDVCVRLRTNQPDLLNRLVSPIPSIWQPASTPSADRVFSLKVCHDSPHTTHKSILQLFEDQTLLSASLYLEDILETFERQLKMYLAETARNKVFVHAGAVGWNGQAIVIPGRSLSGKTSLTVDLVRAGATYYSDEYAVLDQDGRVHPYPTPPAIRDNLSMQQHKHSIEQLGGIEGQQPLPIGLVIVSQYQPDARWQPQSLSTGETILELLNHTVPARKKPEVVLPTLQHAMSSAIGFKSLRGESEEVTQFILSQKLA